MTETGALEFFARCAFVESLNDGKVNVTIWRKMRESWEQMDCE
jgi:hypothetical protein